MVAGMASVGEQPAWLSPGQRDVARPECAAVVVGVYQAEDPGGLVGGGDLCRTSCKCPVRGLDCGAEKHPGDVFLCSDPADVSKIRGRGPAPLVLAQRERVCVGPAEQNGCGDVAVRTAWNGLVATGTGG